MLSEKEKKEIGNRLVELREKNQLNSRQFAMSLQIDASQMAKIEKGTLGISPYLANKIAQAYGVSSNWIMFGTDKPKWKNIPNSVQESKTSHGKNVIPYYIDVNASAGLNFITNNDGKAFEVITIPNVDADAFINVFGDSMYPRYLSGQIIGIKRIDKEYVIFGHAYVIQMKNGEAYLKYIKKGKDANHWLLDNENKNYDANEFHLSKIDKVFIIKAVITKTTL